MANKIYLGTLSEALPWSIAEVNCGCNLMVASQVLYKYLVNSTPWGAARDSFCTLFFSTPTFWSYAYTYGLLLSWTLRIRDYRPHRLPYCAIIWNNVQRPPSIPYLSGVLLQNSGNQLYIVRAD